MLRRRRPAHSYINATRSIVLNTRLLYVLGTSARGKQQQQPRRTAVECGERDREREKPRVYSYLVRLQRQSQASRETASGEMRGSFVRRPEKKAPGA